MKRHGIKHESSTPYTPQQNGRAERLNRTILNKVRCLMFNGSFKKIFWAELVSTAVYLINRTPVKLLNMKTPEEVFYGKKPNLSHLKIIGCKTMVLVPPEKRKKLIRDLHVVFLLGTVKHQRHIVNLTR